MARVRTSRRAIRLEQPPSAVSRAGLGSSRTRRRSSTAVPAAQHSPRYTPQQYPQRYQQQQPAYQQPGSTPQPAVRPAAEQYGQQPTRSTASPAVRSAASTDSSRPVRPAAGPVRPAAGQYGQQPGSTASTARRAPRRARSGRWRVIGGVIGLLAAIIVAVVLVLGFWKPGFFVTTKLDVNAAQTGVQQILTDETNGYGAKNVKDVKCNNGQNPTVKKGDTFNCEVSIDGTKRQVTVTFQDDKGTYEVGRPK